MEAKNSDPVEPRAMRDPHVQKMRKDMLRSEHMRALNNYVAQLRKQGIGEVPDFDPMDGGTAARALFLFEKPGPMTAKDGHGKKVGSGFISRDNDDPTAENTFNFMRQEGIPRKLTITWNVIPGWNGTRKVTSAELDERVDRLKDLIELLPELRAVVFVGKNAAKAKNGKKAKEFFDQTSLQLFTSDHPSPLVKARWPDRWKSIPSDWAKVLPII